MGDLSPRALAALKAADAVLCEDSRTTGAMLARLSVAARLIALHDHNEANEVPRILEMLRQVAEGREVLMYEEKIYQYLLLNLTQLLWVQVVQVEQVMVVQAVLHHL
jgi:16S rRNA C1402 (ribose-2'-O) methylase RsmI